MSLKPTAVDPVCGMRIGKDSPWHASHGEKTYVFCSEACTQSFLRAPERYLQPGGRLRRFLGRLARSNQQALRCRGAG